MLILLATMGLIEFLVIFLVLVIIFSLLWYGAGYAPPPMVQWVRLVIVFIAAIVLIIFLLGLIGKGPGLNF